MTGACRPALGQDGKRNAALLREIVAASDGGRLELPEGSYPLEGGLEVPSGWTLSGSGTTLRQPRPEAVPMLTVAGSGVVIEDLALELGHADPGPHEGAEWTAVTVGRYLYDAPAAWLRDVVLRRLRVRRASRCTANSLTVIGAVHDVTVSDSDVEGGGTGLMVHWGAVGPSVHDVRGPSYHPHRLTVAGLRVRDAFEAFCLSSVHDVTVDDVRADDVEIGFRVLPGDNTDRFHADRDASHVSHRIRVQRCRIGWCGDLYAVRVAGWGRSETDGEVSHRAYRGLDLRDVLVEARPVKVHGRPARDGRRPVVVEVAEGVDVTGVRVEDLPG